MKWSIYKAIALEENRHMSILSLAGILLEGFVFFVIIMYFQDMKFVIELDSDS